MASGGGFLLMGESMLVGLSEALRKGLSFKNVQEIDANGIVRIFGETALDCMLLVAPLFALLVVVTMLTPLGLGGWSFSLKSISFKLEKIDPIKGLGRIFALKGLVELVKVLAKFLLVASVSGCIVWSLIDELVGLGAEPIHVALAHVASLCGWSFMASSSVLIIIAALDAPFQLWQHNKQLKMTKQEVKDENKETDGRPEVKGRIRALQQEMSQRRMMDAVPDADVIITNPTHYAIALKYEQGMGAPICVAKGVDAVALKIREVGEAHEIPIVESPPLARALYASVDLEEAIPPEHYKAVAEVIGYVMRLKSKMVGRALVR